MPSVSKGRTADFRSMVELKMIQINVGKNYSRTNEIITEAEENGVHVLLIQEPYTYENKVQSFGNYTVITNTGSTDRPKTLIAARKELEMVKLNEFTNSIMTSAEIRCSDRSLILNSTYLNKNETDSGDRMTGELILLQMLIDKANHEKKGLIIATDSNARSKQWGDEINDNRGDMMNEFIVSNDLSVYNDPKQGPTFVNYRERDDQMQFGKSYIDLTMSNDLRDMKIKGWSVLQNSFVLDHKLIKFGLEFANDSLKEFNTNTIRYNTSKIDWKSFQSAFDSTKPIITKEASYRDEELEELSSDLIRSIMDALEGSAPVIKHKPKSQPWYSENLRQIKHNINSLRKSINRNKKKNYTPAMMLELKQMNKHYKKCIKEAKDKYYTKLNKVNNINDLWKLLKRSKSIRGESFSIFKKQNGETTSNSDEINTELFEHFVPKASEDGQSDELRILNSGRLDSLRKDELKLTVKNKLNSKAPGLDSIDNRIMKYLFNRFTTYFEDYYNLLLKFVYIPKVLKRGNLILFQKPNKNKDSAKGLRPITLLPVLGKVAEHLFMSRINEELNKREFYNGNQHGFTKQRSTCSAIEQVVNEMKRVKKSKYKYGLLLALDISSAFDRVKWSQIIENVIKSGVEGCYVRAIKQLLYGREVQYLFNNGTFKRYTSMGCPQGGRASPSLWLIAMNSLLEDLKRENCFSVAFADDLSLIIKANSVSTLKRKFEEVIAIVKNWCKKSGLSLSAEKTQMMNIGKLDINEELRIDEHIIESVDKVKCLGIMLDREMKWNSHIDYLQEKSTKVIKVLKALRWRKRDLKLKYRRTLYLQVCLPAILYGYKIWSKNLREYQKRKLTSVQRQILIALTGAYRTTSSFKLQNVMGVLDISEEIRFKRENEAKSSDEKKINYKERLREESKELYDELEESETKELIWFVVNHGPFRTYLKRFGLDSNETCRLCGHRCLETPEHLLRECEATREFMRIEDESELGELEAAIRRVVCEIYRKTRD